MGGESYDAVIRNYFGYLYGGKTSCVGRELPAELAKQVANLARTSTGTDEANALVAYYLGLGEDEQKHFRAAYASALEGLITQFGDSVLGPLSMIECPEAGAAVARLLETRIALKGEMAKLKDLIIAAGTTRSSASLGSLRFLAQHGPEFSDVYDLAIVALAKVDWREMLTYLPAFVQWYASLVDQESADGFGPVALCDVIGECARQGGPPTLWQVAAAVGAVRGKARAVLLAAIRLVDLWPDQVGLGMWYRMSTASRCALR